MLTMIDLKDVMEICSTLYLEENVSAVHTFFLTLINYFIGYGRLLGKFLCMLSFKQSTNTIMLTYY